MGISTNADLYYGILFEEYPWDDWEEYYAEKMGILPPKDEFDESNKEEYHAYWDKKRKAVERSVCEIDTHCSCDYPMYYVCVKASHSHASRGYPEEVKSLKVQEDWDEKLKSFCEIMGIEYEQPKWWLSSLWC